MFNGGGGGAPWKNVSDQMLEPASGGIKYELTRGK